MAFAYCPSRYVPYLCKANRVHDVRDTESVHWQTVEMIADTDADSRVNCMRLIAKMFVLLVVITPAVLYAAEDEAVKGEFFERKIRPLLVKRCYECHSNDTADQSGHLALDSKAGVTSGGSRGPLLNKEQPDTSLFLIAVRYADPKLQMPPEGKLPQDELDVLTHWVQHGAYVPDYGPAGQKKSREIDWNSARQFWSFQPIKPTETPAITQEPNGLDRQPLDAFILHKMTEHNLRPASTADPRTLVRRLSFDLLGLPPDQELVAEFIADDRPDAYERLVDQLLASPHFGERWGRYWLDMARYTDVTPSWLKNADQAWLYRDWIIRAINEDLPYDLFVKRQLAADLLENPAPEDYAALGLIGLSPTYWKELQLAPDVIEVIVADEWDERIDAVTRTFLGLTVACARCHDHKFDPITAKDYYALAGIFASTQLSDRPLLPSPMAEQIAEARGQADKLEEAIKASKEKESEAVKKMMADLDAIKKSTPNFDARMAHVVEEASVYVMPDGPNKTRLDIRKKESRDLPVFRRGNPSNPGDIVPRRYIEVLSQSTPQPYQSSGSGRRELAESLFKDSQGLTARVIVNRIWSNHFGRGIVKTPSDFGAQGDQPTHPELLESLAAYFVDQPGSIHAWSLKRLHRQMVASGTYRQASRPASISNQSTSDRKSIQDDPDNQWLSRMSRRRLDVEPWRDTILAAAGNLDDRMGGPATELDQASNMRRTLYGRVGRDEQNDMLRLYDFPPPTSHSPARDVTTTPLQQLFVLNSDFVDSQATSLATRIQSERPDASLRDKIIRCYQVVFQREPSDIELKLGEQFLATEPKVQSQQNRWPLYVQSLFGLNEVLFID